MRCAGDATDRPTPNSISELPWLILLLPGLLVVMWAETARGLDPGSKEDPAGLSEMASRLGAVHDSEQNGPRPQPDTASLRIVFLLQSVVPVLDGIVEHLARWHLRQPPESSKMDMRGVR